jgi:hypothetical protein
MSGTAVAATAAAARNDLQNVGIAFNATILSFADSPGSCVSPDGCEFFDNAVSGVDAAQPARSSTFRSAKLRKLSAGRQRAVNAGIILVISAGDGEDHPGRQCPFALVPAQISRSGDHRRALMGPRPARHLQPGRAGPGLVSGRTRCSGSNVR